MRDADIVGKRRARSIAAATIAMKAFGSLRDLDAKPGWERERNACTGKDGAELTTEQETAAEQRKRLRGPSNREP